jgi:hypothetical protein
MTNGSPARLTEHSGCDHRCQKCRCLTGVAAEGEVTERAQAFTGAHVRRALLSDSPQLNPIRYAAVPSFRFREATANSFAVTNRVSGSAR